MITTRDVVSDETVERLWSGVEAGLPRSGSRAPFARAGIIAGIVALAIGGSGIASYAVVQTVASAPEAAPTPDELELYPDAPALAKSDDVSVDEAIRRIKLDPELDRLRSELQKAAGTRLHSMRIERKGRFGIDLALTLGSPIPAVDEIVAAHPELVGVRYVDGPTNAELLEVLEKYGPGWQKKFPAIQAYDIIDGNFEIMTPDASQDEAIRAYASAHGAGQVTITFVHAVLMSE